MKNKFTIWLTILIMAISIGFNACVDDYKIGDKFLDKAPGVDVNLDTIFSKAEYARYFLWNTYNFMYFCFNSNVHMTMNASGVFETLSDCYHSVLGWDNQCRIFYPGIYNAGHEDDFWEGKFGYEGKGIWEGIRSGWIFIENVDRVPDMTESEKERLKAEAKIIIATRYFDLLRHVGGLPIVDHAYTATEDFENPRATIEETINFVIRLCDEAAATPSLPWNIPDNEIETWFGRLTRASAMGLKCKVLLFAASPLFNDNEPYSREEPQVAVDQRQVWYGGFKQELWEDCRKACEEFFAENERNGSYYQLVQPTENTEAGYCAAYRKAYWTRGNSEKIISTMKRHKFSEWDQVPGNVSHNGAYAPTAEFSEMFSYADGSPFDTTGIYNTDNPSVPYPFDNRDPRLYENMVVQKRGFIYQGSAVELWEGGTFWSYSHAERYLAHGIGLYKWVLDYWHIDDEPVQWPYLRMGEMHLIYAEALAETGNLPKACDEVNKVRARVGMGKIETMSPGMNLTSNKENLIKEILRERACELGMEDTRLYDMVRRKSGTDFTKQLHGIRIYRKDGINEPQGNGDYPELRYERYPITQYARAWWTEGFWKPKWYLSALPPREINKGYGLTQNPGW